MYSLRCDSVRSIESWRGIKASRHGKALRHPAERHGHDRGECTRTRRDTRKHSFTFRRSTEQKLDDFRLRSASSRSLRLACGLSCARFFPQVGPNRIAVEPTSCCSLSFFIHLDFATRFSLGNRTLETLRRPPLIFTPSSFPGIFGSAHAERASLHDNKNKKTKQKARAADEKRHRRWKIRASEANKKSCIHGCSR